jgi:hypothetical protein
MSLWLIGVLMCKRKGESEDHLLHCDVACVIWNVFFKGSGCLGLCRDEYRFVCLLVDCRQHSECCCFEIGAFVPFVVFVEENE